MAYVLLPIDPKRKYILEDVPKIDTVRDSFGGSHYGLHVVLSYIENGQKHIEYLTQSGVNIQFARDLHIGAEWYMNKESIPFNWKRFSLPQEILRCKQDRIQDIEHLSKGSLFRYQSNRGKMEFYSKRVVRYVFDSPISIDGHLIHFILIPSFEIARYFLFGVNNYNEYLINSSFNEEDRLNQVYNPQKTIGGIKGNKNGLDRYVQLRKGIDDSCSRQAGDLAFNWRFRKIAQFLGDVVRASGRENYKTFYRVELPITKFEKFETFGIIVQDQLGKDGVQVQVITKVTGYSTSYVFGRDNDSRTIEDEIQKVKSGNRMLKSRKTSRSQEENIIEHTETADKDYEKVNLVIESDFNQFIEVHSNQKIEKQSQDFMSDLNYQIEKREAEVAAGGGVEGGKNGEYYGLDNSPDDPIYITPLNYWLNFENVIDKICKELNTIETKYLSYKNGSYFFSEDRSTVSMVFKKSKGINTLDYYLIHFKRGCKSVVLIEFNPYQVGLSTIVLVSNNDANVEIELAKLVLYKLSVNNGNFTSLKDDDNITKRFSVFAIRHRYFKPIKDGFIERYKTEDAIDGFKSRILRRIKEGLN